MFTLLARIFGRKAPCCAQIVAGFQKTIDQLDALIDAQSTLSTDLRDRAAEIERQREEAVNEIELATTVRSNIRALING